MTRSPDDPIVKLILQYDGTNFLGWQRQSRRDATDDAGDAARAGGASIQELIERALEPLQGAPVTVTGAGRTDAGVHALAQVASAPLRSALDEATLLRALNAVLPPEVRVVAVERAAAGFHARFSARAKTYEYRIVNGPFIAPFEYRYAWHLPHPLDVDAMRRGARCLVGRHDFAAFRGSGSDVRTTERTVHELTIDDVPPRITLRVTADGFLRHMVRTIAGTLVEVGSGRAAPERVEAILRSRDRRQAGPTAPAHGLFLVSVAY